MPDWDNTESRESDEDAAWRDLVARFEEPVTTTGPAPWPERENVPGSRSQASRETGADGIDRAYEAGDAQGESGTRPGRGPAGTPGAGGRHGADGTGTVGRHGADGTGTGGRHGADGTGAGGRHGADGTGAGGRHGADGTGTVGRHGADGTGAARGAGGTGGGHGDESVRGFDDEGVQEAFGADGIPGVFDADGLTGKHEPDVIQAARRDRRVPAHGTRARRVRARKATPPVPDDEQHYVPPAPPPLPRLDPIAKGAWLALFGGPGYLVVTTAAGWPVSGIAAFLAVAAFVTGFAILVLRMNEPGPGGPDDGDDGAVV